MFFFKPSRAHALALFLGLWEVPVSEAFRFLPPRAAKLLKRALKQPRLAADLDRLRGIRKGAG